MTTAVGPVRVDAAPLEYEARLDGLRAFAVVVVMPVAATIMRVSAEMIWLVSAPTSVCPVELTVRELSAVNISRMPAVVRL